jgi:hypothetical protein
MVFGRATTVVIPDGELDMEPQEATPNWRDVSLPLLDADSLKRFSTPELADTVRELWFAHPGHSELRRLLLRLISLGSLKSCADLAIDVALAKQTDRRFRLLAGQALVASANDAGKRQYSELRAELANAIRRR